MRQKLYIYIIDIAVALAAMLVVTLWRIKTLRREIARLRTNIEVEIGNMGEIQQLVTKDELKSFYDNYLNQLKEYGVKSRNVENIVNVEYRYKDTVRVSEKVITIYDTIRNGYCQRFDVETDCYSIKGEICDSVISIDEHEYREDLLIALYREKRECLFGKRKVKAIAVGVCKGDTLKVVHNLKVQRNR